MEPPELPMPGVDGGPMRPTAPRAKADGALLSIGEVTRRTGVAPHILRYWERHVPALRPLRRAGARRYYRPEDVALIERLQRLVREERYTLDGAARAVGSRTAGRDEPTPPTADMVAATTETDETSLPIDRAAIARLRDRLAAALVASEADV